MSDDVVDEADISFDEEPVEPEWGTPVDDPPVEDDSVVIFTPSVTVSGVRTPSGAVFSFRSGAQYRMRSSDVEYCWTLGIDGEVL